MPTKIIFYTISKVYHKLHKSFLQLLNGFNNNNILFMQICFSKNISIDVVLKQKYAWAGHFTADSEFAVPYHSWNIRQGSTLHILF